MLDKVLGFLSIALLIGFMGIVVWYINRPALTTIVVLVVLLAIYDFWRDLSVTRKAETGPASANRRSPE